MGGIVDSLGSFAGLSDGLKANLQNGNSALGLMNARNDIYYNPNANAALEQYGNGTATFQGALDNYNSGNAGREALADALATNATTGSRYATEQVQNNPILGQLFGENGALGRANTEEQKLASQGFQLQPQDVEAYGQASGNIARLFGQQEQGASQSLADRGLAASPSGAAGAIFSGLQGNKNEQLAQSQMQIANQRMQNTMQRLNDTRNFMAQLGSQGANDIQQQYGRQLAGAQNSAGNISNASQQQINQNTGANQANLAGQNFEAANKPKNIADFWTAGTGQGLQSETAMANNPTGTGMQAMQSMGSSGGGMAAMFSDSRLKENIKPISTKEVLASLKPYSFTYKGQQETPIAGIMAQDLESTDLGKSVITEIGGYKAIDHSKALSLILASLADMHKRIERLEQ